MMLDVFAAKRNLSHDLSHSKMRRERIVWYRRAKEALVLTLTRNSWRSVCLSVCGADKVG